MKPGLYQVTTRYLCAGFVVERDGSVVVCAPILRKRLRYWMTIAQEVVDVSWQDAAEG